MKKLLKEIYSCKICLPHLLDGVNPIISASQYSKIAIIGQAPGKIVHQTGIPWNDKSGERLRNWLSIGSEKFYDPKQVALIPMGFCYPGKGKSGDLPPRSECAPKWHESVFQSMRNITLIILIGSYAQSHYLAKKKKPTLTETIRNFEEYLPRYFVLPHPSPRNNIWMKKNSWFEDNVLPVLKEKVKNVLLS